MHRRSVRTALGMAVLIGFGLSTPPAQAGYVVTLTQQDMGGVNSVVATGSGPIDLTGLTINISGGDNARMFPSAAVILTGPTSGQIDAYTGLTTGPTDFGSGGEVFASSGNGDLVGVAGAAGDLAVPTGYTSGNPLSDTSTYTNQTFATLGVTPGTYEWTWGTGPNQNFTLDVVVPEPSSLLLLAGALAGLVMLLGVGSRSAAAA